MKRYSRGMDIPNWFGDSQEEYEKHAIEDGRLATLRDIAERSVRVEVVDSNEDYKSVRFSHLSLTAEDQQALLRFSYYVDQDRYRHDDAFIASLARSLVKILMEDNGE